MARIDADGCQDPISAKAAAIKKAANLMVKAGHIDKNPWS